MADQRTAQQNISSLIFGPAVRTPDVEYLDKLRIYIHQHPLLSDLVKTLLAAHGVFSKLPNHWEGLADLQQAQCDAHLLVDWISGCSSASLRNVRSGVVALPLLVTIQIAQYFRFLEVFEIRHGDIVSQLRRQGGVQGYCGGLLSAIAVACSIDLTALVQNAAIAIRVAILIGLIGDKGDGTFDNEFSMFTVKLNNEAQIHDLTSKFPGVGILTSDWTHTQELNATLDTYFCYHRSAICHGCWRTEIPGSLIRPCKRSQTYCPRMAFQREVS